MVAWAGLPCDVGAVPDGVGGLCGYGRATQGGVGGAVMRCGRSRMGGASNVVFCYL